MLYISPHGIDYSTLSVEIDSDRFETFKTRYVSHGIHVLYRVYNENTVKGKWIYSHRSLESTDVRMMVTWVC